MTEQDLANLDPQDDSCLTKANYRAMAKRVSTAATENLKKSQAVREARPADGPPISRGFSRRDLK